MRRLVLADLSDGMPALTSAAGERLAEAASVCLEEQGHSLICEIEVSGDHQEVFLIARLDVSDQLRRTYDDAEEATEEGACGIAILLARELTGLLVVRRTRRGTGFDYYLGNESVLDFQARLEVSGIRRGTDTQIASRVGQKRAQTERSDTTLGTLTAYAIVVEFSNPKAVVDRR